MPEADYMGNYQHTPEFCKCTRIMVSRLSQTSCLQFNVEITPSDFFMRRCCPQRVDYACIIFLTILQAYADVFE